MSVELNTGSGGATVAADEISGEQYQIVKLDVGADGVSALLGNSNPVPVSDAGGTLTVDGTVAVTNAGLTELAAAINASSQMDVNIAASAATLTVASHAVTNAGTFATQVDGSALTALQLIDNIVAAEDAVAGSGFAGVPMLVVRQDSHSDLAADGDFIAPTIDADGGLRVSIVAGAGSGGTAVADDADFVDGTTSLTPIGGVYESTPSSVTDGDIGMAGITSTRALRVHISSYESNQVDDAAFATTTGVVAMIGAVATPTDTSVNADDGGAVAMSVDRRLHVDADLHINGTAVTGGAGAVGATTQRVTLASDDPAVAALQILDNIVAGSEAQVDVVAALPAGDNNIGNVDVLTIAAGDNNIGNVDIVSLPASTNTLEVVGDVAHDAAAAGNPVQIGARATNSIEGLTQVAAADATFLTADLNGCLVTRNATTLAELTAATQSNTDGTEDAWAALAAGGAGVHNFITSVTIHNAHATTMGYVALVDGTGGTVFWVFPAPATGGSTHNFDPPLKQPTANTGLFFDPSAAITTIYVSINGFQAKP